MTALAAVVPKPPRRRARDEEQEQRWLVKWANTRRYTHTTAAGNEIEIVLGDYLVASANGAYLSGDQSIRARQWQTLKAMGCRPGASDLMLYVPRAPYHGMSIEMKKRHDQFRSNAEATRAISLAQATYLQQMRTMGYHTAIAYGWVDAAKKICLYLGWDPVEKGI